MAKETKTYCYEYHPLWYSYPCEPVELYEGGPVIDQALGMYGEDEKVYAGEVEATSLRGAKMKASRLHPGANSGKWERSYHPRLTRKNQEAAKDGKYELFWCHVKRYQNTLYLWEKDSDDNKSYAGTSK